MTTYNHIHLSCCDNSCVLITSESTASGTQTTIHPSSQICETLFGQPNTCWTVYPIKATSRSIPRAGSTLVSLLKKPAESTTPEDPGPTIKDPGPITVSTTPTQTDPVVVLDTGVGRPPALFSTVRVSPCIALYYY